MRPSQSDSARFNFVNLDADVRSRMSNEVMHDLDPSTEGVFYFGKRLTPLGQSQWPETVLEAVRNGSPELLADALLVPGRQVATEIYQRGGTLYSRRVNVTAARRCSPTAHLIDTTSGRSASPPLMGGSPGLRCIERSACGIRGPGLK